MDPDQNLRDYLEACKRRDWHRIAELSEGMADWCKAGGAAPAVDAIGAELYGKEGSWSEGYDAGYEDGERAANG